MALIKFAAENGMMNHMGLFQNVLFGIVGSLSLYLVAWKNLDQATDRLIQDNKGDVFDFIVGTLENFIPIKSCYCLA